VNKDEFVCCRKVSHKEYDIFQSNRLDFLICTHYGGGKS